MSLTRKLLKGMGLTDEQIDTVIDAHTETVDGLKEQISKFRADAGKLEDVQKELNDLKGGKDWKAEYDKLDKSFRDYKSEIASKETLAAKQKAFRDLLTAENIPAKYHDKIVKMTDLSAAEIEDGAFKDEKSLRSGIKAEWSDFIPATEIKGADTATPPANNGAKLTRQDIYKRDDHGRYVMSTAERQKALETMMKGSN